MVQRLGLRVARIPKLGERLGDRRNGVIIYYLQGLKFGAASFTFNNLHLYAGSADSEAVRTLICNVIASPATTSSDFCRVQCLRVEV